MAKSKMRENLEVNSNDIISFEEKKTSRTKKTKVEKRKSTPATTDDKINITYTEFAANQERTELVVGEGKEFDNDTLLKILGFEEDEKGILRLQVGEYNIDRDNNGEKVRIKDNKIIRMNNNVVDLNKERKQREEADIDRVS